jgi:hypothetical protein
VSPTKAEGLKPSLRRREDGGSADALPELPSPGIREADGSVLAASALAANPGHQMQVDKEGNVVDITNVTYAVAVFP